MEQLAGRDIVPGSHVTAKQLSGKTPPWEGWTWLVATWSQPGSHGCATASRVSIPSHPSAAEDVAEESIL